MKELHRKKEKTLRAAWLISLWAPLGTGVALYFGQTTVLLADFLRRNTELLGLFLAWLAYRRVMQGPDEKFHFGAEKMEDMVSLIVGIIMGGSATLISFSAVQSFISPEIPGWLLPGFVVAGGGVLVNGWFWFRFRGLNRAETTPIFTAQGGLYRAKALIDLVVLTTLILISLGWEWSVYVDPVGSLIIALFLFFSGFKIAWKSIFQLLDRSPGERFKVKIMEELNRLGKTKNIKARSAGNKIFVEAGIEFPQNQNLKKIQEEICLVKKEIKEKWPAVELTIYPAAATSKEESQNENN